MTKDPLPESECLPAGYQLDRYVIESELAPTSVGRMYRARDTALDKVVAINVLATSLRHDLGLARFRESFRRAFRQARDQVHEYGEFEGIPYIVVAYSASDGAGFDVGQE